MTASLGRTVAIYRLQVVGKCGVVSLWDPLLDPSCSHNLSSGKLRFITQKHIPLWQTCGLRA